MQIKSQIYLSEFSLYLQMFQRRKSIYFMFLNVFDHKIEAIMLKSTTARVNPVCIWATTRQNVSSGVSDQVRLKLACSAIEAS